MITALSSQSMSSLLLASTATPPYLQQMITTLNTGSQLARYEALNLLRAIPDDSISNLLHEPISTAIEHLAAEDFKGGEFSELCDLMIHFGSSIEAYLSQQPETVDEGVTSSTLWINGNRQFHPPSTQNSALRQFGKIVHHLWTDPNARQILEHWAFKGSRTGRSTETHLFTDGAREAQKLADEMIQHGLLVRYSSIPKRLLPGHSAAHSIRSSLQWLVAQAGANEAMRRLPPLRHVSPHTQPPQIYLSSPQQDRTLMRDNDFNKLSQKLWGQSVSRAELIASFEIDLPSFTLKELSIRIDNNKTVHFHGIIATNEGHAIGSFKRAIPQPPSPGKDWIATGDGFNIHPNGFRGHGIARGLTQKFLSFCERIGVDALEFKVGDAGCYVWPRLGFDFATKQTRNAMKVRFAEYLHQRNIRLTPEERQEFAAIKHAWQLAEFTLTDGRHVGEGFLLYHGQKTKPSQTYQARFWVDPNYPGWITLLKEHYPADWDSLSAITRHRLQDHHRDHDVFPEVLLSDKHQATMLLERLGNWILPATIYLRFLKEGKADMYGDIDRESILSDLYAANDVLHWMIKERRQQTQLGLAFWQQMNLQTRSQLPNLINELPAILRVLQQLDQTRAFTPFATRVDAIPQAYPKAWDQLSTKTRRALIQEVDARGAWPQNEASFARFISDQIQRHLGAVLSTKRRLSQGSIFELRTAERLQFLESLFWLQDIFKMIADENRTGDPIATAVTKYWNNTRCRSRRQQAQKLIAKYL